ncbi:PREDICTED: spidroin-2-like isoform X2 [Chinchilla lanigera]|uniref:spidroin-2-like isoform X2 n=1 Tax=Chinchilla lanigera TaxID=34839 RepID=UPI0006978A61|nr:PREDICTED: spidroin-2-like isoform X2 [Chinchilla lanigera]
MGIWALSAALFLLCLTPESLQGGLPPLPAGLRIGLGSPNGYRSGYGPPRGLEAGFGGSAKPQKPGIGAGVNPQKPGYGTRPGAAAFLGVGAQPGPVPQNGHGPAGLSFSGAIEDMKPQKLRLSSGNGMGAGPFLGAGVQPGFANGNSLAPQPGPATLNGFGEGPAAPNGYGPGRGYGGGVNPQQPGFGGDMKPQKAGLLHGNGLGAQPGFAGGRKPQKPGPAALNGYGPGLVFPLSRGPAIEGGRKLQKPGYSNGNGLVAQSALTPATQWGQEPQKAGFPEANGFRNGYQPPNGYGPGAELSFVGGPLLQKVGFAYRNGALGAGVFPEAEAQPGFPEANGFRNGQREKAPMYPKAAGPALEGVRKKQAAGQPGAQLGSPWPYLRPWATWVRPGYGHAGLRSQPGPYGQLKPALGPGPFGSPEVKSGNNGQLEASY